MFNFSISLVLGLKGGTWKRLSKILLNKQKTTKWTKLQQVEPLLKQQQWGWTRKVKPHQLLSRIWMSFFWETLAIVMMLQVLPLALLDLLACAAIVLQQKIRSILFYFFTFALWKFSHSNVCHIYDMGCRSKSSRMNEPAFPLQYMFYMCISKCLYSVIWVTGSLFMFPKTLLWLEKALFPS